MKKNKSAVALGSIKTPKKSAAARENGKRGGRPAGPRIVVKSAQDSRISGGGSGYVVKSFSVGPRSLVAAVRLAAETRSSNRWSYGNIGCGKTWVEIGGAPLSDYHESEIWEFNASERARVNRDHSCIYSAPSLTEIARDIIVEYI